MYFGYQFGPTSAALNMMHADSKKHLNIHNTIIYLIKIFPIHYRTLVMKGNKKY